MIRTVTRFLARERELDVLSRRLGDATKGRGGVVAISGPPGIGTTTLARQACEMARARAMAVTWGECREGLLDRPYGALADALETGALTMPPGQVMADLGADAGPILRICPRLAEVLPTIVPAVPLEPVDERLRLREAIAAWLGRMAARAPLLVVLDEFQLADGDLRAMVEHLGKRLRTVPVLVLSVSSSAPAAKPRARKTAASATKATKARVAKPKGVLEALPLEGLDVGAVAALLGAMTDRPVMPATVEVIQAVANGNPLLSLELFRHMADEGLLPGPGVALPAPSALPQALGDVVAWRVARLPAPSRAALNVLAAFHRGATATVVAAVTAVVRGRAVEALDALVADALATFDEPEQRYAVAHPAIRVALLDAMPALVRAQLHRRLAEVVEAAAGDDRRQRAGELAHYWFASNTIPGRERGLGHFLLATEQARAAYAHHRAVDCLRAALTLAPDDDATSFDLMTRLAVAEAAAGLHGAALATALRVLDMGGAATPLHAAGRDAPSNEALSAVTDTLRTLRGDGVDPHIAREIAPVRDAALAALGADRSPKPDSLPHARFTLLAEAWEPHTLSRGSGVDALVWSDLQQPAATTLNSFGAEADKTEVMLLQRPRNRAETAAAAESARSWRRPPATLRALAATATDLVTRLGLFAEATGWAAQYLATAERYGSPRDRVRALALLARCQVAQGSFATAQDSIDAATALLPALAGGPSPSVQTLEDEVTISQLALAYFIDGDWPALLKSIPPPQPPRTAGVLLVALRALASKRAGKAADASAAIDALLAATAELAPLTFYRDAALQATLSTIWELGAAEHAPTAHTLLTLARNAGAGGQAEASLELAEARLLGLAGRLAESRTAFAAARAVATSTGLMPQLALADYDEAIAIAAAGPRYYGEALNLLSAAGEKFERLGMRGWSDRVSSLTLMDMKEASAPGGRLFFTYPRGLSRREADLVRLIAGGAKPGAAAAELEIKKDEADRLIASALKKMRGKSVDELPQLARKYGLGGL